jgi:hypothetical protein
MGGLHQNIYCVECQAGQQQITILGLTTFMYHRHGKQITQCTQASELGSQVSILRSTHRHVLSLQSMSQILHIQTRDFFVCCSVHLIIQEEGKGGEVLSSNLHHELHGNNSDISSVGGLKCSRQFTGLACTYSFVTSNIRHMYAEEGGTPHRQVQPNMTM